MSYFKRIFLKNTDDEIINPATSDKQDEIIDEIIVSQDKQDELKTAILTTQEELLERILLELQKINIHLAIVNDMNIKDEDGNIN